MPTQKCPQIEEALLVFLAQVYPGRVPVNEGSQWAYGVLAGHQQVIDTLRTHLREQQTTKANLNVLKPS